MIRWQAFTAARLVVNYILSARASGVFETSFWGAARLVGDVAGYTTAETYARLVGEPRPLGRGLLPVW
jgi:hypothetical protein